MIADGEDPGRTPPLILLAFVLAQSAIALTMGYLPAAHGSVKTIEIYNDVEEYFDYSNQMLALQVPYRDFLVEYPPLAPVSFLIPRLAVSTFGAYKVAFSLEMLAFNAACVVLVARWAERQRGATRVIRCLAWYSAFFVLCNPTAMARFDLAVMFVTFAAASALLSGRPILGGRLASAAVLLKVFPGAVAGPAFLRELAEIRTSRPRAIIASAASFAVGVGAWLVIGGREGVLKMFLYHTGRGLEIGSVYAGVVALLARLSGTRIPTVFNHLAQHLETPLALRLASLATFAQLGAGVLALAAYWRSGFRDGLRYSTACLLAFIVFGKVLSPQYLIWLIPFVACLEGRAGGRARATFLVACALTILIYPYLFSYVGSLSGSGILLLNARNLVLVALYGLLIFDRHDEPRTFLA